MLGKEYFPTKIELDKVLALIEQRDFVDMARALFGARNIDEDSVFQTTRVLKKCDTAKEAAQIIYAKGEIYEDCLLVLGFACGLISAQEAQKEGRPIQMEFSSWSFTQGK